MTEQKKNKGGRPKGAIGKLTLIDRKAIELHASGMPLSEALREAGYRAWKNSSDKWKAKPAVKAELDRIARESAEQAVRHAITSKETLDRLSTVRFRMARYLVIGDDGLPRPEFPEDIGDTDDFDLPTYVEHVTRTVGRGAHQREHTFVKINYPDDNATAMNRAKLNGELVDLSRMEISGAQDNDIIAAREYERSRRSVH